MKLTKKEKRELLRIMQGLQLSYSDVYYSLVRTAKEKKEREKENLPKDPRQLSMLDDNGTDI